MDAEATAILTSDFHCRFDVNTSLCIKNGQLTLGNVRPGLTFCNIVKTDWEMLLPQKEDITVRSTDKLEGFNAHMDQCHMFLLCSQNLLVL